MSKQASSWLIYFILIEFFIVFLFIISCYAAKLYFVIRHALSKRAYDELKEIILNNNPIPIKFAKDVELILRLFKNFESEQPPDWEEKKITIIRDNILPYARKYINKKSWEKRYFLTICFSYYLDINDHQLLIQLINDKQTIISFNAMHIASKVGTKPLLKAILYKLHREPHSFHAFVIHSLLQAPQWNVVIKEELTANAEPWLKKIGYEILRVTGASPDYFDLIQADCNNKNINIRLAAIRLLPFIDKTRYLESYKKLIKDENWMVRNTIVKTLREVQDLAAMDLLVDSLQDPQWWVRANAAKTLANYGDAGQLILAEYKYKGGKEMAGYDETAYFLKIQQLRKEENHG
ncbi:HEAT repeat domain-containing protein [Legionella feeleii]|uniref:HEAT repeat n=1 Tax=Legionella feeleii TaxID=453 RepID=A0A378ITI1_9GAMM|nr:HEAT repeat domain-containing protein [Legionella feeleii]STX37875.1 HEAT repeat [Legionella feeleii]